MRRRRWWQLVAIATLSGIVGFSTAAGAQQTPDFDSAFIKTSELEPLFEGLPQTESNRLTQDPSTSTLSFCSQPVPLGDGLDQVEELDLQATQVSPPTISLAYNSFMVFSSARDAKAAVKEAKQLADGCEAPYAGSSGPVTPIGAPKLPKLGDARAALRTTFELAPGADANAVYILEARGSFVTNLYASSTLDFTDKDVVRWAKVLDKHLKKLASSK